MGKSYRYRVGLGFPGEGGGAKKVRGIRVASCLSGRLYLWRAQGPWSERCLRKVMEIR